MLDLVPANESTAEARRSRELKEADLGMGVAPVKGGGAKKRSTLLLSAFSESGYGSADDLDSSRASAKTTASLVAASVTSIPRPISRTSPDLTVDTSFDDSVTAILGAVTETKIITTVFEVLGGGMGFLLEDLEAELSAWFQSSGLLVIASEMVWSVPAKHRQPRAEVEAKEALFSALRRNNRRVLDLRWPKRRLCAPIALPEATTEELGGREKSLCAYQGTHRRFYPDLLPVQHSQAAETHADHWSFARSTIRPEPELFMYGNRRNIRELTNTTLLALNITAVAFA